VIFCTLMAEAAHKSERVGAVQPVEEKAVGRPYSSLPVPEEDLQESWTSTIYKGM